MTLMTKDRKNTRKEQILLTALKIACNENKDKIIKCIKESEQ